MCAPERSCRQRGVTLVEMMVGIVVGLLITLAAIGSSQLFMARQRGSVDVGSTVGNAAAGLAAIQYEVAHAGIGFYADGGLLCPRMNLAVGSTVFSNNAALLPLNVTVSGSATTLDILYASALQSGSPATLALDASNASTSVAIASLLPVAAGEQVMLVPAKDTNLPCTVRSATAVTASTPTTPLSIDLGSAGTSNQVAFAAVNYSPPDALTHLGQLQWTRFRLDGTDLRMERRLASQSVVMARNVMAFRVEYGITDGVSEGLASWQKAEGAYLSLDAAHLGRVRAVRVGLVVRSDAPEKKNATGACTATADPPVLFDTTVTPGDADWQCYRYRVTTAVVPLRNFIMGTGS